MSQQQAQLLLTQLALVQTALTATFNSYGNRQISPPSHKINTPLNRLTKIWYNWLDYIREGIPKPNLIQIHPWGLWAMGEIELKILLIYLYLFSSTRTQIKIRSVDGFLCAIAQKTWNHARMCVFGVTETFVVGALPRMPARELTLLQPHVGRCQSSATSIFQPPPSRCTTTSSQHARPSGVLRRRSDGLECAAWPPPRPVAQCRQFQEDASGSECTWTLSALEALRNALYKFDLLTYLLTYTAPTAGEKGAYFPRIPHLLS